MLKVWRLHFIKEIMAKLFFPSLSNWETMKSGSMLLENEFLIIRKVIGEVEHMLLLSKFKKSLLQL